MMGISKKEEQKLMELRDYNTELGLEREVEIDAKRHDKIKTLQSYTGGPNIERIMYMEKHSSLAPKGMAVSVEQVAIFMTSDGTIISFFEFSADDIE
jgi:hypothetical protein